MSQANSRQPCVQHMYYPTTATDFYFSKESKKKAKDNLDKDMREKIFSILLSQSQGWRSIVYLGYL